MKLHDAHGVLIFLTTMLVVFRPIRTVCFQHLTADDLEFVRTNCNESRFPDVCFKLLSPYAGSFGGDVGKMALKSAEISLSKVQVTFDYILKLKLPPRSSDPILVDQVGVAKDLLKNDFEYNEEGLENLRKIVPRPRSMPKRAFKNLVQTAQFQISNVELDMENFLDEFSPDSPIKADVAAHLNQVLRYGSVPVSLLNRYIT